MTFLIQVIVSGIAAGVIYGVIAVGFSLLFRTTRLINFAQGDLAALGIYGTWFLVSNDHIPLALSAVIIALAVGLGFAALEPLLFRRLYRHGMIYALLATMGLSFVIQGLLTLKWANTSVTVDPMFGNTAWSISGVRVLANQVGVTVIGIILTILLAGYLRLAKSGVALRCIAADPSVSQILGLPVRTLRLVAFFAAGVLSAFAGVLVAPATAITPSMGVNLALAGFAAAVIGGVGSIAGSLVGGICFGVIENIVVFYTNPTLEVVISYGLIAVLLLVRPEGIFGEEGLTGVRSV